MKKKATEIANTDQCNDGCKERTVACKLTTHEMQQRKATVISSLTKQILEKKELNNGYAYRFKGTDEIVDQLSEFIKTERLCCDFFDFELKIAGDASFVWLSITGPKGTKDFITSELNL